MGLVLQTVPDPGPVTRRVWPGRHTAARDSSAKRRLTRHRRGGPRDGASAPLSSDTVRPITQRPRPAHTLTLQISAGALSMRDRMVLTQTQSPKAFQFPRVPCWLLGGGALSLRCAPFRTRTGPGEQRPLRAAALNQGPQYHPP